MSTRPGKKAAGVPIGVPCGDSSHYSAYRCSVVEHCPHTGYCANVNAGGGQASGHSSSGGSSRRGTNGKRKVFAG